MRFVVTAWCSACAATVLAWKFDFTPRHRADGDPARRRGGPSDDSIAVLPSRT